MIDCNVHETDNRSMHQYFWGPREPCPCPEKKCVIMKKSPEGVFAWMPENCSEKHNYMCTVTGEL